jgi:hypothetical protein
VVVISACYSGVFIPRLANPDVLDNNAAENGIQIHGNLAITMGNV